MAAYDPFRTITLLLIWSWNLMKDQTESLSGSILQRSRLAAGPTPSLRIPVTRENRPLLRRLRAAELSAWEGQPASLAGESSRGRGLVRRSNAI
jgi:hypothetical protein